MQTSKHGEHTQGTIQVYPHPEQPNVSDGNISPKPLCGFQTRKGVQKKSDAELIERDVKTSQGHATKKKILKWSESHQPSSPKAKVAGTEVSWAPHQPARTFSSCKIFPTKSSWGAILGLKGKMTGQNNNDTTWNPSSPALCFPPACRELLLEATETVPCLSVPSSWTGVNSSETFQSSYLQLFITTHTYHLTVYDKTQSQRLNCYNINKSTWCNKQSCFC